jgi:hypothetical protein
MIVNPIVSEPMAPGLSGVQFEYLDALRDTQAAEQEYGQPITIHYRLEGQILRDLYGSIIGRPSDVITMPQNAATITYTPTTRALEKAGLREVCDVAIYVAMKDFMDAGLAFDDLEIKRMTIDIGAIPGEANGNRYEVKEKARAVSYGNGYLYITFGLKRG